MNLQNQLNKQQGVASLFTALIILICITLVVLVTSKTVIMETKMTADNHRISQAVGSANYAMDLAYNYFDQGGLDQDGDDNLDTQADIDGDGTADSFSDLTLTSAPFTGLTANFTDVTQTTSASLLFNNVPVDDPGGNGTRCVAVGTTADMKRGEIQATGFSDDGVATRTITQCVGPLNILADDGPDQPLVSRGNVAMTGSSSIINRYTNTTVWSGGTADLVNSVSMATYINGSPGIALTDAQLIDPDSTVNTELVSNKTLGNGLDIIDDDPSLAALTGEEFFTNFFNASSYEEVKNIAKDIGQYYLYAGADADPDLLQAELLGKGGLFWVEGTSVAEVQLANNNWDIGSSTTPVILVINGNFRITGGPNLYGLLYVIGKYTVAGTPTIIGSNIVEGTNTATGLPVTPPAVDGNGTLDLVYSPVFASDSDGLLPGLGAIIDGSWKDW